MLSENLEILEVLDFFITQNLPQDEARQITPGDTAQGFEPSFKFPLKSIVLVGRRKWTQFRISV
eukprot:12912748-Prorocentrum_lima.AAC.1